MDVVLAVHELAANAIRHGAGVGRLRVWNLVRELCWSLPGVSYEAVEKRFTGACCNYIGARDVLGPQKRGQIGRAHV